jgi:23S rRNA pseudouridine2457 synthase
MLNKPFGVLCQFSAVDGRETLADYVPIADVYPAGRLDRDSEGLLLLTNDGQLQNQIASPRFKQPKVYCVQVEGSISTESLKQLRQGVRLKDGVTAPCEAREMAEPDWLWPRDPPIRFRASIPTSWVQITLTEGKNRQVRRMTAAVGFPTLRLIRSQIGAIRLDGLDTGIARQISPELIR